MIKIFVAGAYSTTEHSNKLIGCLNNMQKGIQVCARLISLGYAPFCPWLDFLFFLVGDRLIEERTIRAYTIEFLKSCDVMLVISNPGGGGVNAEMGVAEKNNIPIVHSVNALLNWSDERRFTNEY